MTISAISQNLKLGPTIDFPEGNDPFFGAELGFEEQLNDHFSFEANISFTTRTDNLNFPNVGSLDAVSNLFQIKPQANYYFSNFC